MRKKKYKGLLIILLFSLGVKAQKAEAVLNYITTYKDIAISEMKRTGVPAAITLAQGIHESGAGLSELVKASNNHFGIKCKSNWTGESVRHDDDAKAECFRKYPQAADSYRDHSDFLKNGQRYAFLFQLDPADYAGWANGLKKAGYATNPKYPQVLIKLVEDYGLQQYTLQAFAQPDAAVEEAQPQPSPATPNNSAAPSREQISGGETAMLEPPPAVNQYPEGLFTINDTKVIFVKKGTSYFAIATQYGVDLARLFEYNEIPVTEEAGSDQLLYLQHKRKSGATPYHVVKPGETMHDIAQQEGIRMEALLEYNGVNKSYQPAAGEKIRLKKKQD
ncbi:MAG: glucosaminidase domain-containing protein [Bacteroidetes bacterium]|nr:glucosaminidase domain-containing protein [Bacteroidota bacterium]